MVGLLAGIGFLPIPAEFQILLENGDLVPGLEYVTIEVTQEESENKNYLTTMFQGAAAKQKAFAVIHAELTIKKAEVNGKPVVIVFPSAAAPSANDLQRKKPENGKLVTSNKFDDLIRDLADADYVQRPQGKVAYATQTAFQAKGQLIAAGKEAVPAVINCLTSQGPSNQRALAAQVLGEIGDVEANPVLIEALTDPEMVVRGYSAEALGKIGDRQSLIPLQDILNRKGENSSVKAYAEGALKRLSKVGTIAKSKTEKKWWQLWK